MEWALLPLLFAHWWLPQDQPLHWAHEPYTFALRPSHLPVWMLRIGNPLGYELRERLSARWRDVFAVDLVAALQQPVDFIEAAAAGVHSDDCALSFLLIQRERLLQVFDQRAQYF